MLMASVCYWGVYLQLCMVGVWRAAFKSMSEEQQLREPAHQQRLYSCFCGKLFTTYPGLYLHLKSKHGNLFHKYKRLKITKLFRKTTAPNGAEHFHLDPLPEKETQHHERKPREPRKKSQSPVEEYHTRRRSTREEQLGITLRERPVEPTPQKAEIKMQLKVEAKQDSKSPAAHSPAAVSSCSVPNEVHQQDLVDSCHQQRKAYETVHALYPQTIPLPQAPTIKRCLERYLYESNEPFALKLALKNTLYNLMVFIDKNYESLKDPRAKDRIFLSYCEEQDFSRAAPLIRQYYSHFHSRSQQPDESVQERVQRTQLAALGGWLKQMALVDLHLEQIHNPVPPRKRFPRRRGRDSDDSFQPEEDASEEKERKPTSKKRQPQSSSHPSNP